MAKDNYKLVNQQQTLSTESIMNTNAVQTPNKGQATLSNKSYKEIPNNKKNISILNFFL